MNREWEGGGLAKDSPALNSASLKRGRKSRISPKKRTKENSPFKEFTVPFFDLMNFKKKKTNG